MPADVFSGGFRKAGVDPASLSLIGHNIVFAAQRWFKRLLKRF
jgi:hypothetical protein